VPDATGGTAWRCGDLDGARPRPWRGRAGGGVPGVPAVQGTSPNTVKSYARALALWWTYLAVFGLAWDALTLADVGGFLAWLRSGDGPQVISIEPRPARFAESTISTRLRAVTSCYRFHELNGVALGGDLVRVVHGGRPAYQPMLEHVARTRGPSAAGCSGCAPPGRCRRRCCRRRRSRRFCAACARFDAVSGRWTGQVRDRLLWSLLAEAGLRLGEALGLQQPGLAYRTRRHPVHRGGSPRASARGSGSRAGSGGGCSSPMSWTGFTGSTCGSCARRAPTWRCRTWTPRRSS